ncbi:MAG TPA: arginase family protein [Candidatus Limnocylindria bacterium]|nr:arginase family protein [Candidatus Limnocylindria bacterium]
MSTFLGLPSVEPAGLARGAADAVVLGVPFGVPYPVPGPAAGCAGAPAAIRARSQRLARFVTHHDFDLDGPMLPPGSPYRVVDGGDVPGSAEDGAGNAAATEAAVRQLLAAGATPLLLGGDDSVPIPVLRAYAGHGPISIVQVDAHLDFRDEVAGVRDGYSSAMRRASEMGHVERIVQVGLRGVGSARSADVADARAAGNLLVTAQQLHERGVSWLLDQLPADASVVVAFDLDGLDPSVAPAVSGVAPGGLSYAQAASLLEGLSSRTRVAGAVFTEMVPDLDANGLTALVVVRLLSVLIGGLARRSIGS